MVEKNKRFDGNVINLKSWKLRRRHKRLFNLVNRIKKLFKNNKGNDQEYNNSFRSSVNH